MALRWWEEGGEGGNLFHLPPPSFVWLLCLGAVLWEKSPPIIYNFKDMGINMG